MIAEYVTASGALMLPGSVSQLHLTRRERDCDTIYFWASSLEIKHCLALLSVYRYLQVDRTSVIHIVNSTQVLTSEFGTDFFQQVTHAQLCIFLDLMHVELHNFLAILLNKSADQADAFLVCRNLGFKVIQIVGETAGPAAVWILSWLCIKQFGDAFLVEFSLRYQFLAFDGRTFLIQLF